MREKLLERLIRYVSIHTASDENSTTIPSTSCQFDLAKVLTDEMTELGISNVHLDNNCYVYGYIPATPGCESLPALGFIAHMDTVSDFCNKQINPVVHGNYDGKDIYLEAGDITISTREYPHLKNMVGRTIITSDGTTILGADDKAGIAEILTMAEELINSEKPHGKICIAFTPDEEIGSGAELLDLKDFGAEYGFTLDGDLEGGIEYENFNAASGKVKIKGVNVHPGSAKNIMVNSAVIATEFHNMLPEMEQPQYTEGYEGFFHLMEMTGSVEKASMSYIIRDHDRDHFEDRKKLFIETAEKLNEKYGVNTVTVEVKDSYYNMVEKIHGHMHLIDHAKEAVLKAGVNPEVKPIRGGTDGACLSFRGLPCPNLGTGGFAFHGPYEHISLEGMESAVKVLLNLIDSYSFYSLVDRLEAEKTLSDDEFLMLFNTLENATQDQEKYLYEKADKVRREIYGTDIYIRGLIEISNYCKNDCYYRGIRRSNKNADRYRLTEEEILACCDAGYELGFRTFVMQGGEDPYYTDERICHIVSEIKKKYPDCAVTLSIGEKSEESYRKYYESGADRYLLRHETADFDHYRVLHPAELSAKNRQECLYNLKKIGYQVGCGIMVGAPGQTIDHILKDLRFMEKLQPHMIGIGPFIPHKDTPFAQEEAGTLKATVDLLAILRLMFPKVLLPATTALGTIDPLGREKGIKAGANVIMPNLSPEDVRDKYLLYNGKVRNGNEAAESKRILEEKMEKIGV